MTENLELDSTTGLSSREAAERLKAEGYNELPVSTRRGTLAIALGVAREPMFLLLIVSGAIYMALGDQREGWILFASVLFIMGIEVFQERKTERALEALKDLSSPRALVVRDGEPKRIAGREVVRGDALILTEGDRVPADATVLSCNDLLVDESLLTGESVPVRKAAWDGAQKIARPGGDDLPFVYSGTMLVQGRGMAKVEATGALTEFGRIGKALESVESEETFLQKKSGRLVRSFAVVGMSLCALVVVLYGLSKGNWLNGFLVGIALAMSLLPEEIPVVLTVFLALGAWRMSQKRVLTRRLPAIETLGSATVLCVDKTGTLTLNRMEVGRIFAGGELHNFAEGASSPLPPNFHELVRYAMLASETEPFDPMERAFKALGDRWLEAPPYSHLTLAHEYSLSPDLLAMSHVWQTPGGERLIAAKGAPEAIAELCRFDAAQSRELADEVDRMARDGLRVIGVAKASFGGAAWPPDQRGFAFEFLGLMGLSDPVRPAVPRAIEDAYRAGVKVVMITGDYASTAAAIGRTIGLQSSEEPVTGAEIDRLSDAELGLRARKTTIFARVLPEQKLKLVEALKAGGEIVAMTGDGVNDAPALKAAHIGIAMGGRGTDVAREAAALVLLDDDFATIVAAIRAGRRIFDNIRKAMGFIFAIHVPIAGMALIPLVLDWPLVLSPVHIVFLELIIDPACSIAFEAEPEETDVMARPPREPQEPLFGKGRIFFSVLQGLFVLLAVLAVFALGLYRGRSEAAVRALTFTTMVIGTLVLIVANRSWSRTVWQTLRTPNAAFRWVAAGALGMLGLVLYTPALRAVFHFDPPSGWELALSAAIALIGCLVLEGARRIVAGERSQ